MSQFIESIQIFDGQAQNISCHQERINRTFEHYFKEYEKIELANELMNISFPKEGKHKLRIVYSSRITNVQIKKYNTPKIASLKLVEIDFDYDFKYANRQKLSQAMEKRGNCDDILMVKNGFITDTYFCNVALLNNNKWYTPKQALLNGTKRKQLIDQGILEEKDISAADIDHFEKIFLFNAMNAFGEIEIPTSRIL